jgi:hypothetical protein
MYESIFRTYVFTGLMHLKLARFQHVGFAFHTVLTSGIAQAATTPCGFNTRRVSR